MRAWKRMFVCCLRTSLEKSARGPLPKNIISGLLLLRITLSEISVSLCIASILVLLLELVSVINRPQGRDPSYF